MLPSAKVPAMAVTKTSEQLLDKAAAISASLLLHFPREYVMPAETAPFGNPPASPMRKLPQSSFFTPVNGVITGENKLPALTRIDVPEKNRVITMNGKSDGITVKAHRYIPSFKTDDMVRAEKMDTMQADTNNKADNMS